MNNPDLAKAAFSFYRMAFINSHKAGHKVVRGSDELRIIETSGSIVFVFKGSDDIKDWISNFDSRKDVKVGTHRGFWVAGIRFFEDIKQHVDYFFRNSKPCVFIGYSRGGALALLSALSLLSLDPSLKVKCITFGQPKVFFKPKGTSVTWIDPIKKLDYTRVVYKNDIVPEIPLKIQGYKHLPGKEIILKYKWWEFWHYLPFLKFKIMSHMSYDKGLRC